MTRPILIFVTLLLTASAAMADAPEARKHYDRGMRAYNLQDFKGALSEFQKAYVEMPDPAFLFNIAQAQRQLGDYAAAAKSYRLFLANQPDAPNREQVVRLIEQMDQAAKERRASLPPPGTVAPQLPPTIATLTPPTHQAPPPHRWYASPFGWGLIGSGVAIVGASGGLLGVAMAERDKALSATTQTDFDAHHNRSITFQQAGWPLLGVGGACVVAGGVVLAINAKRTHQ